MNDTCSRRRRGEGGKKVAQRYERKEETRIHPLMNELAESSFHVLRAVTD